MNVAESLASMAKDSFAGQICYKLSGRHWCKPYYESQAYQIPEKYTRGAALAAQNHTIAKQINEGTLTDILRSGTNLLDGDLNGSVSSFNRMESTPKVQLEGAHDAADLMADGEVKNKEQNNETSSMASGASSSTEHAEHAKDEHKLTGEDKKLFWANERGIIIVDWDSDEDPTNPHNWHILKKSLVAIIMALVTASLYMGSALYTPAEGQLIEHFHTTTVKATLGLSMFVWGYGLASLWFSPMSENPMFGGRNYIYLFNQFMFVILQIPTALVNHVAPFAVLRLLAGFMAAPPLSTGGATFNDIFTFPSVVYALIIWSVGGVMGPCIGPLIGGALVQHNSWRWAFWYLLIQAGAVLGIMVFFFPETSHQALLMNKARSLRRRTGNANLMAPGDIELQTQSTRKFLRHIFYQPLKLTFKEPVLLLLNIHLGLTYAIMYLYFEAVPIAYGTMRGWNLVEQGLSYVSILVGCYVMGALYLPYLQTRLIKPLLQKKTPNYYHVFGNAAIASAVLVPIGILLFGWTSTLHVHWIVSMVGNAIFGGALWLMFQSYLSFLANLYPPSQIASVFASNSVARSLLAAAFPLFGRPMYNTLATRRFPVGWGCTLLAFLGMPLILLPIYMRQRGEQLHERAVARYGTH